MKNNSYIAVTVSENGKYYSYMIKHHNSNNLLNIAKIKGILHANICYTKKEAERIVLTCSCQAPVEKRQGCGCKMKPFTAG